LASVQIGDKRGVINKQGEEVIPLIYDDGCRFIEELARVKLDNKCGFINEQGEVIIPLIYDDAG